MNAQQRCSFLAALILAPTLTMGAAFAQTLTAPPAPNAITAPAQKTIGVPATRQYSQALIVLNARGAKLDGKQLVLTLGEAGVAGNDERHFGRPTDAGIQFVGELRNGLNDVAIAAASVVATVGAAWASS